MLRYMKSRNTDDACQNCKYYIHYLSRCWLNVPKDISRTNGTYIEHMWLSPCKAWKKGYVYVHDVTPEMMATGEYRIEMFKRIDPEAW